jgi:NRAMP (natural resistance-associated macrophage protein)-like metal ion transporter
MPEKKTERKKISLKARALLFVKAIGPGFITGAADDDPSGIGTYSTAGAQLGLTFLWTAFVTWPLMTAVQMMCARIGMVTGRGLGSALKLKFPKPILLLFCIALFAANTFNVGADLAAMGDAAEMLSGLPSQIFVILFGLLTAVATVWLSYIHIARVLTVLALFLFSYVIAAFVIGPDWHLVAQNTFIPHLPKDSAGWSTLVAILGTTISPYLFYWQASQEVEEKKAEGMTKVRDRIGTTQEKLVYRVFDVGVGTFFSNAVMFFIILTTGLTLHSHGAMNIETSSQAAEALRPLAGPLAAILYTIGLVGTGLLAIPTLTGSAAYAWAETLNWRQGLNSKPGSAKSFYRVILFSTAIGITMDFMNLSPVRTLYWSAVLNGLLAPFLLVGILFVARDKKIMHGQSAPLLTQILVLITTIAMFGAAFAMFYF